jgi:cytochrome c
MPQATALNHPGREEHIMRKTTFSALIVLAASTHASGALAQDAAAGKTSFNKCLACHAIGEGAKNKVGPELNGIDGRKSGTAPDYSYSDANKNSGITWNKELFLEYIKDEGQDSRHQDGIRRHQEREGGQRPLGLHLAIRSGREAEVALQGHVAQQRLYNKRCCGTAHFSGRRHAAGKKRLP